MGFYANVLADSTHPTGGPRLTTMELRYPRMIHSEFMTHRAFSRNSASSRAIPVKKMLQDIREDPFVPIYWGKNQKGMQADQELTIDEALRAEQRWLIARDQAVDSAQQLLDLGLHKQICNRVTEPWMWITVIATGIEPAWENFFNLRCDDQAEPHMQLTAYLARVAYDRSTPLLAEAHLPLTGFAGDHLLGLDLLKKLSTARCARVSYLTHDKRRDIEEDLSLHDRLSGNKHFSPFEHVAWSTLDRTGDSRGGNLGPWWMQYRKTFPNEACAKAPRNYPTLRPIQKFLASLGLQD